jgi:tripartite-type tricarboxylate transporter receptor subunit TctC
VTPNLFVVPATLPVSSMGEFVEYARTRPGKLTAGHPGTGSFAHLGTLLFAGHAGIDLVNVPYKSLPQAVPDLLSGQLSFMILTSAFALPYVKSGKLKALAVDTPARLSELPEVRTLLEAGWPPEMVAVQWFGLVAPAGTPKEVIRRLNGEVEKALKSPEAIDRLEKLGLVIRHSSPEALDSLIRSETERWTRVVKERNLKAD